MSAENESGANVLRIAIIGSGPSGFYAAERLLKDKQFSVFVDMFDRLPTPHGLVRGGVAPDHQKIKSVTKVYDKIAADVRFRFFGHVAFGSDIMLDDLARHYHAVIYAVGAQTDRRMGIPGEDLPGSHPATEFVGWYNGHPDYRDLQFDLTQERVAVIGNGNVAMDVARILARTEAELMQTDIADYAIEALRASRVREIYVLGRRGPAQAAFTNPEIKELGEMADAEVIVAPEEVDLDPASRAMLTESGDRSAQRNVEILTEYSRQAPKGKSRRIIFRFLVSPVELIGTERVEAIKLVKNKLVAAEDGSLRPRPTDETEIIPVGLVFRSIGYKGVALPDVSFDERSGTIPNRQGRVLDVQGLNTCTGEYVVGWIKRGPSGVIGTNKPDSVETVERLLEDAAAGQLWRPATTAPDAIPVLLAERGVRWVSYQEWLALDALELSNGEAAGRPRLKFTSVEAMLDALSHASDPAAQPTGD